jgi:hypothetical protein
MKVFSLLAFATILAGSVSHPANASSAHRCVSDIEYRGQAGTLTAQEYTKRIQYYEMRDGVPPGFYFSTPTRFGGGKDENYRNCRTR